MNFQNGNSGVIRLNAWFLNSLNSLFSSSLESPSPPSIIFSFYSAFGETTSYSHLSTNKLAFHTWPCYALSCIHCLGMKKISFEFQQGKAAKLAEGTELHHCFLQIGSLKHSIFTCVLEEDKRFIKWGPRENWLWILHFSISEFSLNSPPNSKIWIAHNSSSSLLSIGNVSIWFQQAMEKFEIESEALLCFSSFSIVLLLHSNFFFFSIQNNYPNLLLIAKLPHLSFFVLNSSTTSIFNQSY